MSAKVSSGARSRCFSASLIAIALLVLWLFPHVVARSHNPGAAPDYPAPRLQPSPQCRYAAILLLRR